MYFLYNPIFDKIFTEYKFLLNIRGEEYGLNVKQGYDIKTRLGSVLVRERGERREVSVSGELLW